jgi:hypothetical protein
MDASAPRATFTVMEESTGEDWARIGASFAEFSRKLPDRVLAHLRLLDGDYGGFAVDRLQHSLQTATRAHRAGEDEESEPMLRRLFQAPRQTLYAALAERA